jgi:hypothetical protein
MTFNGNHYALNINHAGPTAGIRIQPQSHPGYAHYNVAGASERQEVRMIPVSTEPVTVDGLQHAPEPSQTHAPKRRHGDIKLAVMALLADPATAILADAEIARRCNCNRPLPPIASDAGAPRR